MAITLSARAARLPHSQPLLRFVAGGDARPHRVPDDEGSASTTAVALSPRRRLSPPLRPLPGAEDREEVQAVRQGARVQAAPVRRAGGAGQGRRLKGKLIISFLLCLRSIDIRIQFFFQVEILEAAIRYIDSLHGQLVASVESARLPSDLRRQIEENQSGDAHARGRIFFNRETRGTTGLMVQKTNCPRQNWVAFDPSDLSGCGKQK